MGATESRPGRAFLIALAGTLVVLVAVASTLIVTLAIQNRIGQEPEERGDLFVTADVTDEQLVDEVNGRVTVVATTTIAVTATGVITRDGIPVGSTIDSDGTVLATVDETPILAFLGQVPAYRSLGGDVEGADVLQLQQALNGLGYRSGRLDGVYGEATALAVYKFLSDRDMTPVDASGAPVGNDWRRTGVPLGRIVFVPGYPATATATCGMVGQVTSGELCSFAVQPTTVVLEVPAIDAPRLAPGMKVHTSIEGLPEATLGTSLPASEEDNEKTDSAATARFALDTGGTGLAAGLESSGRVVVAHSGEGALRIEGAALRDGDDSASPWLLLASGEVVPVDLDICAGGYCTFYTETIDAGETVVISGTPPERE